MKHLGRTTLILLATSLASTSFAATEGTVLFAQPGTQIIEPSGAVRSVKRGDRVNTGDRLITGPGAIAQVKLLDGSLLGLRPESEMKIAVPPSAADKSLQVVSLTKGAVRVIGSELMDGKKPSRFTLQSGLATLQLKGADLESSLVPPTTGAKPLGGADSGSYNRMVVGTGSVGTGSGAVTPLAPRESVFVGSAVGTTPIIVMASSTPLIVSRNDLDGTTVAPQTTDKPKFIPVSTTTLTPLKPPTPLTIVNPIPKFTYVYVPPAPKPCSRTTTGQQICL